jgi:hypothetical protein
MTPLIPDVGSSPILWMVPAKRTGRFNPKEWEFVLRLKNHFDDFFDAVPMKTMPNMFKLKCISIISPNILKIISPNILKKCTNNSQEFFGWNFFT